TRKLGSVTAHFVRLGANADNAIRERLKKLGKTAKNWTVVSSDRQVQAEARAVHAQIISSDSFASMLKQARNSMPKSAGDRQLSSQEVDEWLKLFKRDG
ncbi:MAG TPA: NYN domain-containing protein, partial [Anaerolineales bacterium]|nr:NYN domain-containing protein [Anaerolineales bacterium]